MTHTLRSILLSATTIALVGAALFGIARAAGDHAPAAAPLPASVSASTAAAADANAEAQAVGGASLVDDGSIVADLDAVLTADQTPSTTANAAARIGLRRLAALRRLVHGTVVVDLKQGGLTTIQLDHGTISAVTASSVTIAETGGGSVTVSLGDETHVRRDGTKAKIGDLKTSDEVFVMSKVESGGTNAYLVIVPKA